MRFTFTISTGSGDPVTATLKQGNLKPGRFSGRWSAYDVTSDDLPGVLFETNIGIRSTTDVVIEVASVTSDERLEPPYNRSTCTLPVGWRLALLAAKESPCAGCEQDRKICNGEPKAVRP